MVALPSCVTPPNVIACTDLSRPGISLGWCTYTLSNKEFYLDDTSQLLNGKKWSEVRTSSVILPAKESWVPIKNFIENVCHQSGKCQGGVGNWQKTISSINEKIQK